MSKIVFLDGSSIYLRPPLEADYEDTLRWMNDREVTRYMRWNTIPQTLEQIKNFSNTFTGTYLAIVEKEANKHIGNISLTIDYFVRKADIGLLIGEKEYWCGLYAVEAMNIITKFAFEDLGLHRVYTASANPGMIALYKLLKWNKEGVMVDNYFTEGKYRNTEFYAIINPKERK